MNEKVKTARLSIASNIFLVIFKFTIGIISGSVSIISEAIHSVMDLIAAVIAFISVRISSKPPDKEHPYDHGKFENVSGVIEGILILIAAAWIIYEAIERFHADSPILFLPLAFGVMLLSAVVNFFVSRKLYLVAQKTDSIALEADALHLKTDVYTSVGVAVGIVIIWITGWYFIDPIIAILVALLILRESIILVKNAYNPLVDVRLPAEDEQTIKNVIESFQADCISYHKFRTRKSGSHKYVDFHLVVPEKMTVRAAHDLCDEIENKLSKKLSNLDVNIHIEPCKTIS